MADISEMSPLSSRFLGLGALCFVDFSALLVVAAAMRRGV